MTDAVQGQLTLRPAGLGDADFLLELRNDPTTRRFSFTRNEISEHDHTKWLSERLADPASRIWIAVCDGLPAGQLRLTKIDDLTAEVHIAVAPEFRGRGLARLMLMRVPSLCEATWSKTVRLRARILPENEASLRSFRAAGFRDVGNSDEPSHKVLERSL